VIKGGVVVEIQGIKKYREALARTGADDSGAIERCKTRMAARWRAFIQARWETYSRGGGNWKPLKPGYRPGGAILRDTSTMFAAVSPVARGMPGQLEESTGVLSVAVGFGGPARHPTARNLSIADLAEVHQLGLGSVPQRKIIVAPDPATRAGMRDDCERMTKELTRATKVIPRKRKR